MPDLLPPVRAEPGAVASQIFRSADIRAARAEGGARVRMSVLQDRGFWGMGRQDETRRWTGETPVLLLGGIGGEVSIFGTVERIKKRV